LSGCGGSEDGYGEDVRTYGITAGNSINGGFVAVYGNRIYFANPQSDSRLYSMNHDGSDMVRLNDVPTGHINVVDGVIYYLNFSDPDTLGAIYRMNIDGSDQQQILSGREGQVMQIIVVDNQVFHSRLHHFGECGIFVMQTDGYNSINLTPNYRVQPMNNINIIGDYIYFNRGGGSFGDLLRIDIDGSNIQTIGEGRFAPSIVHNDIILFTKVLDFYPDLLYSMNRDGSNLQRLTNHGVFAFNIADDRIFFIKCGGEIMFRASPGKLYSMDIDGSDIQRISDYYVWGIIILGDEVFFPAREMPEEEWMLFRMNLDGNNKRRVV